MMTFESLFLMMLSWGICMFAAGVVIGIFEGKWHTMRKYGLQSKRKIKFESKPGIGKYKVVK